MVKSISVEDRIRRAEEIYEKRNIEKKYKVNNYDISIGNNKNQKVKKTKKEIKFLRKIMLQLLVCMGIYFLISNIYNSDYIFSNDIVNKTKEILSYNTNFYEIYQDSKNSIMSIFDKSTNESNENNEEDNNQKQEQQENQESTDTPQIEEKGDSIGGVTEQEIKEEEIVQLSQYEQDIQTIKNTTSFIKPLNGMITSRYGYRETTNPIIPENHTGTDIAGNIGDKIISSTDGEVVLASSEGGYGNHLKIQIGEVSIIYAHCNELLVKEGDMVKQGQEIATVGSTGNSTGPHLHFEIRVFERIVNPEDVLEL